MATPTIKGTNVSATAPSSGQAQIWNGLQWVPGALASTANLPVLVFKPGAPAAYNVFTNWTDLMTAFAATEGPVVISVDSSLATASVDPGTWALESRAIFTAPPILIGGTSLSALTIPDNAYLQDPRAFEGPCWIVNSNTVGSPITFSDPTSLNAVFVTNGATILNSVGAKPFVTLSGSATSTWYFFTGGSFDSTNAKIVQMTNAANIFGAFCMAYGSIQGNDPALGVAGSTFVLLYDSTFTPLPTMPSFLGVKSFYDASVASSTAYTDSAPLLNATDVQGAIDALKGGNYPIKTQYGSFSNSTDQSLTVGTVIYGELNTTEIANGISVANNGSGRPTRVTVSKAGVYSVNYSAQLMAAGGGTGIVKIWINVNGTPVVRSASQVELGSNNSYNFPFCEYTLSLTAGQYVEFCFLSSGGTISLDATAAVVGPPAEPAVPSLIVNIQKISA